MPYFFATPVFLCLRWDRSVAWSWGVTFIPAFVFSGLTLCCFVFALNPPKPDDEEEWDEETKLNVKLMVVKKW